MTAADRDDAELARSLELIERRLIDPDWARTLDPALVQRLNAVAVRAYAGQGMTSGAPPAFPGGAGLPTASDVCFTVTQMLDAVSVEIFELAMWKSWAPIGETPDPPASP